MRPARAARLAAIALALGGAGCVRSLLGGHEGAPAPSFSPRVTNPVRADAKIAVLWIGHASVLVQIDDRFVLTDPIFSDSVGELEPRLQPPGLDVRHVPPLDAVLLSHQHMDHLDPASLRALAPRTRQILAPHGTLPYLPDSAVPVREMATWESWESDGTRVTAVPVRHVGGRYAIDQSWQPDGFTGYVIERHGLVVYFAGDTAYDRERFEATALHFPKIDLALIPIAPIEPRGFMRRTHVDPFEAVRAFLDLGASQMVPIHFGTFVQGLDAPDEAPRELARVARGAGLEDRIAILKVGEQRVILPREAQ
jgi:L-ascorbate metabolism protein UlaG (beta-lactamase superfamily)